MRNVPEQNELDIDDPRYRTTPVQQMAASCTGALLTSLFVTPLDVVKIRLQAQQKAMSKCFVYCNGLMDHICPCSSTSNEEWFRRPGHFTGTIDAFIKITRNEGITSLWSGLSPTLVLAVPTTVLYFVTYEQLRIRLKDWHNKNLRDGLPKQQPFWIPLCAGASARVLAVSVVSPLELIRTTMQSQKLSYLQIHQALQNWIRLKGILSLWKGLTPTLLRDVPFSGVYWLNYETIKSFYGSAPPSFMKSFIAGAISGAVAATITVPFDVVKTHQQIELAEKQILSDKPQRAPTSTEIIRTLYKQRGIRALFTGLVPRVIKVAPACAIMIATFEHSKQVLYNFSNKPNEQPKLRDIPSVQNNKDML